MLAVLGAASPARAAPCTPVVRGGELTADWQRAVEAIDRELATRLDIERCVDIAVRADGTGASVVVVMGGRRATRSVAEPADLRATLLALVLAPTPAVAPPIDKPVEAPTAVRVHPPVTRATDQPTRRPTRRPTHRASPAIERPIERARGPAIEHPTERASGPAIERIDAPVRSRIDAGLAIGALWTAHDAHPAAALRIRWTRGPWSLGLAGRAAVPPPSSKHTSTTSAEMPAPVYAVLSRELGLEIGRRFDRGWLALTASGGPSLVALEQRQLAGDPASRSSTLVRMGAQLRAETVSSRRLGLFVIVDASWDTRQLGRTGDAMTGAPSLPTWSTGIALGGEVRAWP
jgi:hypothetical protein